MVARVSFQAQTMYWSASTRQSACRNDDLLYSPQTAAVPSAGPNSLGFLGRTPSPFAYMASSVAAARLAGGVSRPASRDAAARGLPPRSLSLPPPRRRPRTIRCCAVRHPGGGSGSGSGVDAGEEFVGFFREAWPYIRGHRGSTFVVVLSSEVVSGPHLDRILQVLH